MYKDMKIEDDLKYEQLIDFFTEFGIKFLI